MPIRALTIDFWNTMVVAQTNGHCRQEQRMAHLFDVVRRCRPEATPAHVENAYQAAATRFDTSWKQQHQTPPTSTLVACIWEALDLTLDNSQHDEAVRVFEEGLLFGPPDFADGLEDALVWASQHYRLGIISDTMFSPGRVIRQLLDQRGVLHYFDTFVFSDETGFSKPDVRAFEQAATTLGVSLSEVAHIGDLRRTDIAGAQAAGAHALLFTGVREDDDIEPQPHAVVDTWHTLPDVLALL